MTIAIALFVLSFVLLAIGLHPFATYPLSLLVLKKLRPKHTKALVRGSPVTFAVCVCAYNEERVIEAKIQNLLALRRAHPDLQIFVYVDAASDRTAEILQRHVSQIELHISPERHGKTYGMNLLSQQTRADVLVFTDANVMLDMNCLDDLQQHFADPEIGCVCGNLNYTNADASVTASTGSLYWKLEEGIKRLESATGSMMGADGSIFAVRRELRRAPPDHIIDDMYVSLMVLPQGHRIVQAANVRAYEESVTRGGEEFGRKVRIACQAFNVHRLIWPAIRKLDGLSVYKYISHKLIRWLSIYFIALAVLAAAAGLIVAGYPSIVIMLAALAIAMLLLGHWFAVKPFAQILDMLVALTGVGLGVMRSVRGEKFQTWTPAKSIRGYEG